MNKVKKSGPEDDVTDYRETVGEFIYIKCPFDNNHIVEFYRKEVHVDKCYKVSVKYAIST